VTTLYQNASRCICLHRPVAATNIQGRQSLCDDVALMAAL